MHSEENGDAPDKKFLLSFSLFPFFLLSWFASLLNMILLGWVEPQSPRDF